MARTKYRRKAGDAQILIVIRRSGGKLVLGPKPGDEIVGCNHQLTLVFVNLSGGSIKAEVEFQFPIDGTSTRKYKSGRVKNLSGKAKVVTISDKVFDDVPSTISVIAVGYLVRVGTQVVDPDLKIER